MIDDRQEHRLPGDPAALDQVARLDGLADGEAMLDALRGACRRGRGAVRPARQRARRAAVERSRHPARRTDRDGVRARRDAAPGRRVAVGPRAVAALARRARRVRGDAAQSDARGRGGARPEPRAQPLQRPRRTAVERGQFLPAGSRRGRRWPALRGADPDPRARAGRPAGAAADAARRADRRQRLRPAARTPPR